MTIKFNALKDGECYGMLTSTCEGKPFVARVNKDLYWTSTLPEASKILWKRHYGEAVCHGGMSKLQQARAQLASAYEAFGGLLELGPDPPPKPESEWADPPPKELREDD